MKTSIDVESADSLNASKRSILWKLEATIELVTSSSIGFVDNQISGDLTQALCTVIEAVFIHGLRDAFFLKGSRHSNRPAPNFWPFVSKYTHRSIKTLISTLNQIHTEIGRARAWVRIVLNDYSLDHYISLFAKDTRQMNQFYADGAFLRDSESVDSLGTHLKRLNGLKIAAPTNSSLLNTWTPSPLSLAGLVKTTPSVGAFAFQSSAAMPVDVPSSSPDFNGLLPAGKGFKVGSSSPSASSSVLLPDDEVAIASGEQQIVAEFGMSADQLLLDDGEQHSDERERQIASADDQRQQIISSASLAMADDLESVYSHPSMLEDPQHPPPLLANVALLATNFDHLHHQRRQNMHNTLFSTTYQNANNKWMLAAMPTEELSTEVIVHRKAAQRHRRRTMSKSSAGDSDNGSSSRCHSNANLHAFEESSLEAKEEKLSGASNANDDGTEVKRSIERTEQAPVFEEETPALIALRNSLGLGEPKTMPTAVNIEPMRHRLASFGSPPPSLGTSLQDELFLAAAVAGKDDDKIVAEELARKKFSATEEQRMALNPTLAHPSGKVTFSYSTDSVDESHELSNNDGGTPATFDEALRDFLDREAHKRRTSRARTSSGTTNVRLFSECSSSSAGAFGSDQLPQQQSPSTFAALPGHQSPTPTAAVSAGGTSSKRSSSATMTAFLFRAKELPSIPFKREKREDPGKQVGSEDELITIPVPPPVVGDAHHLCTHWTTPLTRTYNHDGGIALPQSSTVSAEGDGVYRLPRRLFRLTQIPRELGLDAQEFRCAGCRRNIGPSFGPFNVCSLNGRCYCVGHCINPTAGSGENGATTLIPARVLLNGDFRPRMISRESLLQLRSAGEKPFLRLDMLNPQVYAHCHMLRKIRDLRHLLSLYVLYLFSCKDSIAEDAKRRIWPQKHWHEDIHLYSIADFEGVANGTMERRLNNLIIFAQCHVQGCPICRQKGFFCELCSASDQPIYPFQTDITLRCPNCASVFHKGCAKKAGLDGCVCALSSEQRQLKKCPKCLRRAKYATTMPTSNSSNTLAMLDSKANDK